MLLPAAHLHDGDVIILAAALKHEEGRRPLPAVGDLVRATRPDTVSIAGAEPRYFLRLAQREPEMPLDDVERILDVAVAMPRHLLRRRNPEFTNAEAGPLGITSPALHLIKMARIINRFRASLH
jgi:hypothetical protein